MGGGSGTSTMYFKVPANLQCSTCTLQWHWWSANSCEPAGDYGCFKDVLQSSGYWVGNKAAWWTAFPGDCSGPEGPNGHSGCGEQFGNCADITVLPGNGATTSTTTMASTSEVATSTTTMASTSDVGGTTSSTIASTTSVTTTAASGCEICVGDAHTCIWTDGLCYPVAEGACKSTEGTTWCGSSASTSTVAATSSTTEGSTTMISTVAVTTSTSTATTVETTTSSSDDFIPLDGASNRACRGADADDNDPNRYTVISGMPTLEECKSHCRGTQGCVGIEFNSGNGRCEVWTRSEGIGATRPATGYQCFAHNSTATCKATAASLAFDASDETCSSVC